MTLSPTDPSPSLAELQLRRRVLEPLAICRGHVAPLSVAIINHCQERPLVLSGDVFGGLRVFDATTQRQVHEDQLSEGILSLYCPRTEHGRVYAHLRHGKIVCLDDCYAPGSWRPILTCGQDTFCRMQVFAQGTQLLAFVPSLARGPCFVDIWKLTSGELVMSGIGVDDEATGNAMSLAVAASPCDGNSLRLLVGYDDGTLQSFSVDLQASAFRRLGRIKVFPMTVTCLDYNAPTDSVVLGGPNTDLVLIRHFFQSPHDESPQLYRIRVANEGFSEAVFSPSGRLIVTGGWDGKLRFFDAASLHAVALSNVHSDTVIGLSTQMGPELRDPRRPARMHRDLLLVSSKDKTCSLWSLDAIEEVAAKGASS